MQDRGYCSLRSFALDNPTTGVGGALLSIIRVSQDCTAFSMIALKPLSNKPALLIIFFMFLRTHGQIAYVF